jgi:hypothetical protein
VCENWRRKRLFGFLSPRADFGVSFSGAFCRSLDAPPRGRIGFAASVSTTEQLAHVGFRQYSGQHFLGVRFSQFGPETDLHSIGFCAALRSITVAGWSGGSKLSTIRCSAATIMPSVRRWGAISTPNFAQSSRRRKCSHLAYSAASICQIATRNFLRGGLRVPSSRPQAATARSIISASMPVSRCRCGARKAGFTPTIRAAGSNGTAAITWAAACRKRTHVRSSAGKRSDGTSRRSSSTASLATRCVDRVNAKLCCTGPMTAAKSKVNVEGLLLAHRFRSRHCSITADVEGRTELSRTCRYGSVWTPSDNFPYAIALLSPGAIFKPYRMMRCSGRGVRPKAAPTGFALVNREGTSNVARKVSTTTGPTPRRAAIAPGAGPRRAPTACAMATAGANLCQSSAVAE